MTDNMPVRFFINSPLHGGDDIPDTQLGAPFPKLARLPLIRQRDRRAALERLNDTLKRRHRVDHLVRRDRIGPAAHYRFGENIELRAQRIDGLETSVLDVVSAEPNDEIGFTKRFHRSPGAEDMYAPVKRC